MPSLLEREKLKKINNPPSDERVEFEGKKQEEPQKEVKE
jgi:hypothetical protein